MEQESKMISERDMMLGQNWDFHNVIGWYATEKLFDARCYWDGKTFWSRGGIEINAPDWFKDGLPDCHLDGGVVCGYGKESEAAAIDAVTHGRFQSDAKFMIYDAPTALGFYRQRISTALALVRDSRAEVVPVYPIQSNKELSRMVHSVLERGGEGLMLHSPNREYIRGRTSEMLKLKFIPQEFLYQ